jgi:moderate conductance mechanosensitive channel
VALITTGLLRLSATPTGGSTSPSNPLVDPSQTESWLSKHGGLLISHGSQIAGIVIIAIVLRVLTTRVINRVVYHAGAIADTRAGRLLETGGLLIASERRNQRARAIGSVLRSLATTIITSVAFLMIISVLQLPTAPILASVSVIGVALGLGAQGLVTDFVSGMFMILEDQYGVGDVINVGVATGTVEEVALRVTRLRDAAGVVWHIRNGQIARVGNLSQGWDRALVDLPVAYDSDVTRAQEVMESVAAAFYHDEAWRPKLLDEPPQVMGIEVMDGETVVMRLQVKTVPQGGLTVSRELRARLKTAFDAADIKLTAPPAANA